MTQYQKDPGSIRNWHDRLVQGIGHRGSSFSDLDVIEVSPMLITHDRATNRALIVELKHQNERMKASQEETLRWLATLPWFTAWLVIQREDGTIGWYDFRDSEAIAPARLSVAAFRDLYAQWWRHDWRYEREAI